MRSKDRRSDFQEYRCNMHRAEICPGTVKLPESYVLRKMHAENLQETEDKLFKFLNGWMGGPDLYVQEYGHPMLRRRHMSIQIDVSARDQWLMCMDLALTEVVGDTKLRAELSDALAKLGDHMRNKPT